MTTSVVIEIKTKPGASGDMLALLKEILPATRSYDGCLDLTTFQDQDDPNTLIILSKWQTKAQYETYLDWRKETGVFDTFVDMLAATTQRALFGYDRRLVAQNASGCRPDSRRCRRRRLTRRRELATSRLIPV